MNKWKRLLNFTYVSFLILGIASLSTNSLLAQTSVDGIRIRPLSPVGDLLSGITTYNGDLLVCEYDRNRILRISLDGDISVFIHNVDSPVDIEIIGDSAWILQEQTGELLQVHLQTRIRRTVANDLIDPTAFASDGSNRIYVIEFLTGRLIQINRLTGRQTVLTESLDNPADILVLPSGDILIAQQVGRDGQRGNIIRIDPTDPSRNRVEARVTDASGLAIANNSLTNNALLVTSFQISDCNSGGVIAINQNGERRNIVCNLTGPTSLMVLPNNQIAVIEEVTNSIVLIQPDGTSRYLVRGNPPILDFAVLHNGEIVILNRLREFTLRLLSNHQYFLPEANRFLSFINDPMIEVGGDGNLYLYHSFLQEMYVFSPEGELISFVDVPFSIQRMMPFPNAGIALVTDQGRESRLIFMDQFGNTRRIPLRKQAQHVFLFPNGEVGFLEGNSTTSPIQNNLLIAAESNNRIWFSQKLTSELYVQTNNITRMATRFDEPITNLKIYNRKGLLVSTSSGNLYQVSIPSNTAVKDFSIHEPKFQ